MGDVDTYSRLMIEYLKTAPDEHWMYFVCTSNYDANKDVLGWVVDQRECSASVALAVYWYMSPDFYTQFRSLEEVPGWAKRDYQIIRKIENRLVSEEYKSSRIGFDPARDLISEYDWTQEANEGEGVVPIPVYMRQPIAGQLLTREDIPEGWDEGMPPHIVEIVWNEQEE